MSCEWLVMFAALSSFTISQSESVQNCSTKWTEGELALAIHKKCVIYSPDVRLVIINNEALLELLKQNNNILRIFNNAVKMPAYGIVQEDEAVNPRQNESNMCQEIPGRVFVLVDDNLKLAYRVKNVKCAENNCFVMKKSLNVGECVNRKKTITLQVSNGCKDLVSRPIEVGCNCYCKKNPTFF